MNSNNASAQPNKENANCESLFYQLCKNKLTVQQQRLIIVYMARIADKPGTQAQNFGKDEFCKIIDSKENNPAEEIISFSKALLGKELAIKNEAGRYTAFPIFTKCDITYRKKEITGIVLETRDEVFELLKRNRLDFFGRFLWAGLNLHKPYHIRLYEHLKTWFSDAPLIYCDISVPNLRNIMGVGQYEYTRWDNFKRCVLDECKRSFEQNADMLIRYDIIKRGRGGKAESIRFYNEKNCRFTEQIHIYEYIDSDQLKFLAHGWDKSLMGDPPWGDNDDGIPYFEHGYEDDDCLDLSDEVIELMITREKIDFIIDACNGEFGYSEISELIDKMCGILNCNVLDDALSCYRYIEERYKIMDKERKTRGENIPNPLGYMKILICDTRLSSDNTWVLSLRSKDEKEE